MSAPAPHHPSEPSSVAVVILTFQPAPGMLEACVRSVLAGTMPVDVVVVDNGVDAAGLLGAVEVAGAPLLDHVTLVTTGHNGGYASGVNAGIDVALARGADAVGVLNDDVEVEADWLQPLVTELGAHGDIGAVQPLLVRPEGDVIDGAGIQIDRFGQGADRLRGEPVSAAGSASIDIDGCTGGAVLFGADYLNDVGRFDERFFLYYEDVEFARRGARSGWRYRLVPASIVRHRGSVSTARLGDDVRRLQERNRLWSTAMHGSVSEFARGYALSARRLRHAPRSAHRRAIVEATRGVPRLIAHRLRRRSTSMHRVAGRLRAVAAQRAARRVEGTPGVNLVGYHHISSGLGSNARELSAALMAAGIPVTEIDNDLSSSPRRRPARPVPSELHDTTIAIVTAFEFAHFCERFPQLVGPGKRMIGYWVWELEEVPEQHRTATALVDEIWTPTTFVQSAYRRAAPDHVPVRLAPFRMEEPPTDESEVAAWRSRWGSDTVFVVSFDYLSIVERKNPLGAIAAFRSAFDGSDTAVRLIVKSINGDQRPDDAAVVRAACGDDDRIELLDEHLDDARHHGLLAAADVLVSLHRSEGYGLHPAIAMWLGTAVVATRYSGVVDFMDDSVAAMVDAELVDVTNGQGIYPDTARWADPDIEQAAAHMRRLAGDPVSRGEMVERARRRIADQPSAAVFGEGYAAILRAGADSTDEPFFAGIDAARGPLRRARRRVDRSDGRPWPDSARR